MADCMRFTCKVVEDVAHKDTSPIKTRPTLHKLVFGPSYSSLYIALFIETTLSFSRAALLT